MVKWRGFRKNGSLFLPTLFNTVNLKDRENLACCSEIFRLYTSEVLLQPQIKTVDFFNNRGSL